MVPVDHSLHRERRASHGQYDSSLSLIACLESASVLYRSTCAVKWRCDAIRWACQPSANILPAKICVLPNPRNFVPLAHQLCLGNAYTHSGLATEAYNFVCLKASVSVNLPFTLQYSPYISACAMQLGMGQALTSLSSPYSGYIRHGVSISLWNLYGGFNTRCYTLVQGFCFCKLFFIALKS